MAEGPALTVGLAGAAGVASAVVSCPAELVMLHQQTSGAKMVPAVRQLVATHGPLSLWRGMAPTMMRECLWVGAYLGSVPVLEEGLRSTEVRVALDLCVQRSLFLRCFGWVWAGRRASVKNTAYPPSAPCETNQTRTSA